MECKILLKSKILWLGILATFLNLGCYSMVLSILIKWIGELPETYLVNTAQGIVQSLLEAGGVTLITWASEPTQLGHKWAYFILACCTAAIMAVSWLSGGGESGAWTYLACKTAFSIVGGGNPQGAPYSVLCAWLASELPEDLLTAAFSLLLGAQFATMAIVPILVEVINKTLKLSDPQLLLFATVVALVQLPVVLLLFPSDRQVRAPVALTAEAEHNEQNSAARSSIFKDVRLALRWIFRKRFAAAVIWISINFYAAADSNNILLFLNSGLHFHHDEINTVLSTLGMYGCLITFVVVPALSGCAPRSSIVAVGVLCSVGHSLVYGLATAPPVIISMGFLGSMSFCCIPTLLTYMKTTEDAAASQGALVGTFYGISSVAKMLGPPLLAVCLQSFLDHRGLCYIHRVRNFVGAGFVVLAVSLVPAVFASVCLVWEDCRASRLNAQNVSRLNAQVSMQAPLQDECDPKSLAARAVTK